jgi:hypothetical protein
MPRSFKKRKFRKRTRGSRKGRSARLAGKRRRRYGQTRLLRGPVNKTAVAKLRYCESVAITPTAGSCFTYTFRANDVYDPNQTGTGHQPMGFDQIMSNYQHFTVIGSKITATFIGGTTEYLAAISTNSSSSDSSNSASEIKERQRTVWKVVPTNVGGPGTRTLSKRFSSKKFFHVKALVGESQYKGSASNSPAEQAFFYVYAGSDDGSTTVGTIKVSVTIEYIVVFSEPKSMGQS